MWASAGTHNVPNILLTNPDKPLALNPKVEDMDKLNTIVNPAVAPKACLGLRSSKQLTQLLRSVESRVAFSEFFEGPW